MWYSFSDKWDIVKHNKDKKVRKVNSSFLGLLVLVFLFILHLSPIEAKLNRCLSTSQYNLFYLLTYWFAIIAFAALFVIKYIKNEREVDLWLILCATIPIFAFLI